MEIKIKTGNELNRLLDALGNEIVNANIYHRLFWDLDDSISEYIREFSQSKTFWNLTLRAIRDSYLTHLCRVYDQESTSLNLVNLLHTIKANLHLFAEDDFRQRMAGNAFVDDLLRTNRVPSMDEIEKDIELATCSNLLVKKLMIWRNNIVAHRGAKISLGKTRILEDDPLSQKEVEQLLDQSYETFNKYSSLYCATTWSRQISGHDDYKSVLKFVRIGLKKYEDEINIETFAARGCKNKNAED